MAKQSSVNLDITNNADGFDISGGTTVRKLGITGGDVTIAGSGSAVVTFPTTSTTIAGLGITQSFSALQSFSAGISAAGGITFANDISVNSLTIGQGPVSGSSNTAIGEFVLAALQTGSNNTAVGAYALSSATAGTYNVAIGDSAMNSSTNAGDNNVAIGSYALNSNAGGSDNIAIGNSALIDNLSGNFNVVIGHEALDGNQTGNRNTAIGYLSLSAGGNTANSDNLAIGYSSLLTLNSGNQNTAIGTFAGRRRGSGGTSLLSATGGIYIGYDARASADAQTNEIVIGNLAVGLGSNTAVIGRNTQTSATIYGLVNATSGISTAGATFSGDIAVNGGDITTTSTSATLFNANATSLDILNTQSSGFTLNIGTASSFSGTKRINIGGNVGGGASSEIIIGSASSASKVSILGGITLGSVGSGAVVRIAAPSSLEVSASSTFSSLSTFSQLLTANAGISASGITVGGSISLQNQEFIRNTTNGRMDFMPAPAGSTHYGMYMDFTSWAYGTKLGTIRASDGSLNAAGFLFESSITIGNNVRTSLGSNGQNGIVLSDTGNDTIQLYTSTTSGTNSGAIAIVDVASVGAANRSPGVTHTNPNLYVYRSGTVSANDFIRMEHDGTNGRIVSGGTSGISLEPGSGVVGISGGISLSAGITFADQTYQISKTPDFLLFSMGIV